MTFSWIKKGLVFDPSNRYPWMHEYAQVPTVVEFQNHLRIFFTCRPKRDMSGKSLSYISFIDVAKDNPSKILYIHDSPVLELGGTGSFDEFGVHPGSFIKQDDGTLLFFYQGWTRMESVPYITTLGLATSTNCGVTFSKVSKGPLFSRSLEDPFLENGFFVYPVDKDYYLFYASCNEWVTIGNKFEPVYNIVSAKSSDCLSWKKGGKPLFPTKFKLEASGRPCVIRIMGTYHMWFCYRNVNTFRDNSDGAYRIGYASSPDLIHWERDDLNAGIDVSEEGWDSEMIAYPFVCKVGKKYLMFYNGNFFGKNGFGYAELLIK